MIKNQMVFPLAVDTATVKATTDVGYTATDEQLNAYTIGFVPWSMIEQSMFFKGSQIGTIRGKDENNQNNYFGYTPDLSFETTKGVPFCYSYAQNSYTTSLNAYRDSNNDYVTAPWGSASTTGLIHSYNVDDIITNTPNAISETTGIYAMFKMFVLYVPDGVDTSEGVWSSTSGENGWVTPLSNQTAYIDTLNLTFSVTSGTDSSYMPAPVTFTEADLTDSVNGVMVKENGTTTYGGVTYHRYVHCVISSAFLYDVSSMALKDGIAQLNGIRFANFGYGSTPYYASVATGYVVADTFTCGMVGTIDLPLSGSSGYYLKTSETSYEYFKGGGTYANHLVCGGFTVTDLKIIRSIARPVYKISGSFYVAEFNDDYTITGELIPYAQARAWQKNINGDNNTFDPADIPEPGPEPSDDIHGRHTGSTGSLYGSGVGAVSDFVTHWVLDASQVQKFGSHLWTDLLDFDAQGEPIGTQIWKNAKIAVNTYFQTGSFDPGSIMELLIGLRYFPINLASATYATQMTVPAVYFGTGRVGVDVTTNPWKLNDCGIYINGGSIDLSQLGWNKYDDWRDVYNTSASIYIPFCGTYELPWADIYNGTLELSYGIDVLSGAMTAFVVCTIGTDHFLVCVGTGMVGFEVPITATNANRINAAILGDMGNMASTLFNPDDAAKITSSLIGAETGNSSGVSTGDMEPTVTNAAGVTPIGQAAVAGRVAEMHIGIGSRPGIACPYMPGGRGWGALTGQRIPFLTVRKGRYVEGTSYGHSAGYPRMRVESIGNVSGYTECINPDLSGINCTKAERDMIKQILETGFYA